MVELFLVAARRAATLGLGVFALEPPSYPHPPAKFPLDLFALRGYIYASDNGDAIMGGRD